MRESWPPITMPRTPPIPRVVSCATRATPVAELPASGRSSNSVMRTAMFAACLHALLPTVVLAAPTVEGAVEAPPPPVGDATPSPLGVEIAVELDPAYDDELADALRIVVVDAAKAAGQTVTDAAPATRATAGAAAAGAGPQLDIAVRWYDGPAGDMRVEYRVAGGSSAQGSSPQTFVRPCKTCDATMLVEKVRAEIGRVLKEFEPRPAPADTVTTPIPAPPPAKPERQPLSGLGWAGVGLAAAAALPLPAGIVLTARGERRTAGNELAGEYTDYRPPGLALVGVAAGLLATGVILIVVDRVRARRDAGRLAARGGSR